MNLQPKPETLDPVATSKSHLVVIAFARTTSPIYSVAVSLAVSACVYGEVELPGGLMHIAGFEKTKDGASRALALLKIVADWKATQVFAGGAYINEPWQAFATIECYAKASACSNWRAHCLQEIYTEVVREEPFADGRVDIRDVLGARPSYTTTPFRFPCKLIFPRFRKQDLPGVTTAQEIEAQAVEQGCHFCPFFDSGNFKKL